MDLVELSRLLENLIRIGAIHDVDHPARRCRVKSGRLISGWLRWMENRAGDTGTWNPPTIGEQCVVLSPSGVFENGIVIYGAPSDVIDTPSHDPVQHVIRFPDGAVFSYDHAASHLDIRGVKTLTVDAAQSMLFKAGESVTFDAPLVKDTGKHSVADLLSYGNGIAGTGGGNGNAITGNLTHTSGQLKSNGVVLDRHVHTGVLPGGANTGQPV